jgi:uncharacterized protein YggT (Ycf19 family)
MLKVLVKIFIKIFSNLYNIVLFLRFIFNLLKLSPGAYPPVNLVYQLTEPVLVPLGRIIDSSKAGFDYSPLVAIVIIWLLAIFLVNIF